MNQDRVPFFYVVTHKITKKRYAGIKYSIGCHPNDLWISYFTSSNFIHQIIKMEGKNIFDFQVRKTFNSITECQKYENRFLKRINAANNENWYNKHNGGKNFLYVKPGRIWVNNNKTQTLIDPAELNLYLSNGYALGMFEHLKTQRANHTHSCKDRVWVKNQETGICKRIFISDTEKYIQIGYEIGRFSQTIAEVEKRRNKMKGRFHITHPTTKEEKMIFEKNWTIYKNKGFIKGSLLSQKKGKRSGIKGYIRINNGVKEKIVPSEKLNFYIDTGYHTGRLQNESI
jgi:hypothetical protein